MGKLRLDEEERKLFSACRAAEKQASTSLARGDARLKWQRCSELHNELGIFLARRGNFEEAVEAHENELLAAQNSGELIDQALAYRNIGENYCFLEDFPAAVCKIKEYLRLSIEVNNELHTQLAYHVLGRTYWIWADTKLDEVAVWQEKNEQALECFRESARMIRSEKDNSDRAERLAGVLMNLGNVCYSLHLGDEGHKHFEEAEHLARETKNHRLKHQIHLARADIYWQDSELDMAENQAIKSLEEAKLSPTEHRKQSQLDALTLLGKIDISMDRYEKAARRFLAAHKLKVQEDQAADTSKNSMKAAFRLNSLFNKLQDTSLTDHRERRALFEKMGDKLCSIGFYLPAVEKYEKMLEETEDGGMESGLLKPCYVSLAQTYKDLKHNRNALKYYSKLIKLEEGNPQEFDSALSIAISAEKLPEVNAVELNGYFETAANLAENCPRHSAMNRVYTYWKEALERRSDTMDSSVYESVCAKIEELGESEEEVEDISDAVCEDKSDSEADTDAIIEELDSPDEEVPDSGSTVKIKQRRKVRRNDVGETSLHVAASDGDLKAIRQLLKQKSLSLVNEKDHYGWRPLHEAANHGREEAVQLLLEAGADADAVGGEGITPLMDAAVAGEIRVMKILITNGAKLVLKDRNGLTAADLLSQYLYNAKTAEDLTKEEEGKLRKFLHALDSALERNGIQQADRNWDKENLTEETRRTHRKRNKEDAGKSDVFGVAEYRKAMELTRRKQRREVIRNSSSDSDGENSGLGDTKRDSAFVSQAAFIVGQDWLEDDILSPGKVQRKVGHMEDFEKQLPPIRQRKRRSSQELQIRANELSSERRDTSESFANENFQVPMNSLADNSALLSVEDTVEVIEDSGDSDKDLLGPMARRSPAKKRSRQMKLNFSREVTKAKQKVNHCPRFPSAVPTEPDVSMVVAHRPQPPVHPAVRQIKIKFGEFRPVVVPLTEDQEENNVKWLISEAERRFCEIHTEKNRPVGVRLVVRGADLADTDKISLVLASVSFEECVLAEVEKWVSKGMDEKYVQICQKDDSSPFENVKRLMADAEGTKRLDLMRMGLSDKKAVPIFKALQGCYDLRWLVVSRNTLSFGACTELGRALSHLVHLESLSLVCTGITDSQLQCMANEITRSLPRMKEVDLSQNRLGDGSYRPLRQLVAQLPHLRTLRLRFCQLTHRFFTRTNDTLFGGSKCLENVDLSRNRIGSEGVKKLLQSLNAHSLKSIALVDTVHDIGIDSEQNIFDGMRSLRDGVLEILDLSGAPVGHRVEFAEEMGGICNQLPKLQLLRLEATKFTEMSVVKLLRATAHHPMLKSFDFSHCDAFHASSEFFCVCRERELLFISVPFETDEMKCLWEEKYGSRGRSENKHEGKCEFGEPPVVT